MEEDKKLQEFLREYKDTPPEETEWVDLELSQEMYDKLNEEAKRLGVPLEGLLYARVMSAQSLQEESKEQDRLILEQEQLLKQLKKQNSYFARLRQHPGIGPAWFLTLLFFIAAFGNRHLSMEAALIVGASCSAVIWCIVLLSNFRR